MKALRHWMLHNDTLAQEFDAILKLSPGYNPVRLIDPALSFFASLLTNVNDVRGNVGNYGRASTGIYRASDNKLAEAASGVSRHEWKSGAPIGLFMEPASTNKCQNWNAQPDAALSGLVLGGDASATMTRVDDAAWLELAGLDRICPQYAIRLNNTSGSAEAYVLVDGNAGNLNPHQCSIYWRGIGSGRCQTTGPTGPLAPLPASYERYYSTQTPSQTTNRLMIVASAGSDLYFVLNQLEEQPVVTSPIVTKGAAASRAADVLNWDSSFFSQSEGMAAMEWRPGYDDPFQSGGQRILRHGSSASSLIHTGGNPRIFATSDGTSSTDAPAIPGNLTADTLYLLAVRWASTQKQIGFKTAGTWYWSTVGAYDGDYGGTGILELLPQAWNYDQPSHAKNLYFWSEDKGIDWLEAYFSDVAN